MGKWAAPHDLADVDDITAFTTQTGYGVLWTSEGEEFSTNVTGDTLGEVAEQTDWPSTYPGPIAAINQQYLVAFSDEPHQVLLLGYQHPDLYAAIDSASDGFLRNVSAVPDGDGFTAVGAGPDSTLCDVHFDGKNQWETPHCRADIAIPYGGEAPFYPPQAVLLENGDLAVLYPDIQPYQSGIAVTFRRSGTWTDPISISTGAFSPNFTGGANKNVVDGLVVVTRTKDEVVVMNVSESAGWGTPVAIDTPAPVYADNFAVAPGICGDDVEIEYLDTKGVKLARVKGADAAVEVIAPDLTSTSLYVVTVLTRFVNLG